MGPDQQPKPPALTRAQLEDLVEYTLDVGRQMMECWCGSLAHRKHDGTHLPGVWPGGLGRHVIASQAAVTVKTPTGEHYTSTCMILPDKIGTDLERLETLNAAARYICAFTPELADLPLSLRRPSTRWSWRELLGYILGAGAFAIFFGGVLLDGLSSGFIGFVIYLMSQVRRLHHQNRIIYTTVACFLSGLLAQGCVAIGFGVNLDMVLIGDIMIFIPG